MERRERIKPGQRPAAGQPTLRTIADLAGLGVTTVSRALKDGPELAAETKARVRAIAEEIGYRPHRAGVRLKTGRTFVISFVLNQADDMSDYARRLIMGISEALRGTHYHLQVLPQTIGEHPVDPVRYIVDTQAADGIILTHSEPQDVRVKMLLERDFPFITFGRTELATPHPYIDVDNFDFAYRAARALIARGRERIVIVLPPQQFTYSGHQLGGYRRALFEAGLTPRVAEGVDLYSPAFTLRSYANALATGSDAPDGIICGSELQALGMILGFQEAGFVIGKDVDIVNKKTSNILDLVQLPTLQFFEDLIRAGHDCAKFLLKRIEGERRMSELQRLDFTSFCEGSA
ncbi:MAG: LacI family DNA-binding transcriptional regulator [Parvibaculaceae bacterium]